MERHLTLSRVLYVVVIVSILLSSPGATVPILASDDNPLAAAETVVNSENEQAGNESGAEPLTAPDLLVPDLGAMPAPAAVSGPPVPRPDGFGLSEGLGLIISSDRSTALQGERVRYTVRIGNLTDKVLNGVALRAMLPEGLDYKGSTAKTWEVSEDKSELSWEITTVAAGAVVESIVEMEVGKLDTEVAVAFHVTATTGDESLTREAWAMLDVGNATEARHWITPTSGTTIGGLVFTSSSDIAAPIAITMGEAVSESPFVSAFSLVASDMAGNQITKLPTIDVRVALNAYPDLKGEQGTPALFQRDPVTGEWKALSGTMDWDNNSVVTTLAPTGEFALGVSTNLSYGAQTLPTVQSFASDALTGNSNISYPIQIPSGPGGLGVNLQLSYSSEFVNSIRQGPDQLGSLSLDEQSAKSYSRQASIVGWGWNLGGLGYISRSPVDTNTGTAHLVFPGGSTTLKDTGAAGFGWQSSPQLFLKVEQLDNNNLASWRIWTPDGTRYTFGSPGLNNYSEEKGEAWGLKRDDNTGNCTQFVREAHLTEIQDTSGNRVVITYATEDESVAVCENAIVVGIIKER